VRAKKIIFWFYQNNFFFVIISICIWEEKMVEKGESRKDFTFLPKQFFLSLLSFMLSAHSSIVSIKQMRFMILPFIFFTNGQFYFLEYIFISYSILVVFLTFIFLNDKISDLLVLIIWIYFFIFVIDFILLFNVFMVGKL